MKQTSGANDEHLLRVQAFLSAWSRPWWIAGGWAVDLGMDAKPRAHHDIDIAVLRRDQLDLQRFLSDWSLGQVVGGKLVPWRIGEYLTLPVHEIHVERNEERLEFLLNEAEEDTWLFRRNVAVSLPLSELTRRSPAGIPYFCPQAALLYKAKNPRPVDEEDFKRALPSLNEAERDWLGKALEICHPGHRWLAQLS